FQAHCPITHPSAPLTKPPSLAGRRSSVLVPVDHLVPLSCQGLSLASVARC
ncbi:hypothetical protein JMJ77_0001283, partial [Colletotrichum scovillei]